MSHTDKYNIKKEGEKKTIHSIESPFSPAKIKARSWEMLKGGFLQQIWIGSMLSVLPVRILKVLSFSNKWKQYKTSENLKLKPGKNNTQFFKNSAGKNIMHKESTEKWKIQLNTVWKWKLKKSQT